MIAVAAIVAVAPFERVLFAIPGAFTITTVEAATLAALGVIALSLWPVRARLIWMTPVAAAGAAFLVALVVASLLAPDYTGNSLRFTARMFVAAAVAIAVANAVDSPARARFAVTAFVAVSTIVAIIAVLESVQVPWVMRALTVFRPGFHVVGGQLRATSTLFYPTIASMYLEAAFACGLWLLFDTRETQKSRALIFSSLVTIGAGIAATFTRAGLLGVAAALVVIAVVRVVRLGSRDAALGRLAALTAAIVAAVLLLHSPQLLMTRMRSEGSQAWYGARYEVPLTLTLDTGRTHQVPITLTNTGNLTWDSTRQPAYAMSYHWLRGGSDAVVQFDGRRTPFAAPVPPGESVTMAVTVTAPGQPGRYTLVWDVVLETRAWLSTEGVPPARTDVTVEGEPSSTVTTTMKRLPQTIVRPGRIVLWTGALRMAREHPFAGVGPDNYRLLYGRYLGLASWDDRVHSNNMYLEILAGAGVAGLVCLLWFLGSWGTALARRCREVPSEQIMPAAAMLAAWLMIAGHGLVDSFLSFTTTYLTFAIVLGLSFARAWLPLPAAASNLQEAVDADRV